MGIISVILNVFLMILIVLGALLAFLLFILIILLVCPLKYQTDGSYSGKFVLSARVSWLFSIIKIYYDYNEEGKGKLTIFGKVFAGEGKKERKKSFLFRKRKKIEKPDSMKLSVSEEIPELQTKENIKENILEEMKEEQPKKKKKKRSLKEFFKSAQESLKKIKDKLEIINHPDRDIIIKETLRVIKRVVKALGLKRHYVYLKLGLGDPADTATALGAILAIAGTCGLKVQARPDFDEKALEVNGHLYGLSNLFRILFPLAVYALKKPIWKLIKKYLL